jgi:hypothetical protein
MIISLRHGLDDAGGGHVPGFEKKKPSRRRGKLRYFSSSTTRSGECEMLTWAAVLFAIAALGGATLATMHFKGRMPLPMPLALLHGLLAASGLVLLIIAALTQPGFGGLALAALVIFVIAALGGFYLFAHHLRGQRLPSPVVLIHGGAAVVAFLALVGYLVGANP